MESTPRARALFVAWSVAASLALAGGAAAVTVELTPARDNTLIETPVGNSNGAGDGIYAGRVGTFGGGTRRRGLIAFDLTSIPAGSTVDSVSLGLVMAQSPDATARTVALYRVSADWGEAGSVGSGSGAVALAGDATWLFRLFDTVSWTSPGGDFAADPSASQPVADIGPYTWTGATLVADAQSWVDHPETNFGWLVLGDESVQTTVKKFYSREGLTAPLLTVAYTPQATGVPAGAGDGAVSFAAPWPMPAAGRVNLSYVLPRGARVSLSIHDAMGRLVRNLATRDTEPAGRHAIVWDGQTDAGARAAPGIYLATLVVDHDTYQHRIAVVR